MHPNTKHIAGHMKDYGLHLLGRAVVDATFAEIPINPYGFAMGVGRCAHAAEIIIKARIAQEHPLLIFSKIPKPKPGNALLEDGDLLEDGRTIMYSELPDALWAATGYKIKDLKRFNDFGKLRNKITHLGVPTGDLSGETLKFAFKVMEPMIRDFWSTDIYEYIGAYDTDADEYVHEQLKTYRIPIKPPPSPIKSKA